MMLEVLFVVVIAALLITISVRFYLSYQERATKQLVQNDLATLREALVTYYRSIPCDQSGQWQGAIDTDIIDQLTLTHKLIDREPMVSKYKAYIRTTNQTTKRHQPVYLLEVRARLTPRYQDHIRWLQSYFNATSHTKKALIWRGLPPLFRADQSKALWVMSASRAQFQQYQTKKQTGIALSHAYCAR